MSQDNYYKDLSHMPFEERVVQNFDHPDLIDFELFAQQLRQLKNGESVQVPNYSFCQYTREKGTRTVEPAEIIIVDGILLFAVPEIRALCDLKVFVEADDDVRLLRRIERDMRERGRSFESVRNQWLATVMPMHEAFVQPSRRYADVIIPAYQQNDKGIALLIAGL